MATGSSNRCGQDTTLICSEKTGWKEVPEKPQTSACQVPSKEHHYNATKTQGETSKEGKRDGVVQNKDL